MLPIVWGVECEISTDNASWITINATTKVGCLDNAYDVASIQNLDADTLYYFRCRNDSHTWNYLSQKTEAGGINEMYIALTLIGIVLLSAGIFILLRKK